MEIQDYLAPVLTAPTPAALWQLRRALLEAGLPADIPALAVLSHFYLFLNELAAKATAHQYSHFASLLDIGAVGGVAVQNLLESRDSANWWSRLLAGGMSESMMVLAARQYVKAWEGEMAAGYNAAAWYLYEEFWRVSAELQPDLPPTTRRQLIERLFAPLHNDQTSGTVKAALIGRLFQLLLLVHLRMSK